VDGTFAASRRLDGPTRWVALIGVAALFTAAFLTLFDVLLRWLFSLPIPGVDDATRLLLGLVVVSAFPAGLLQGNNVTIRFLGHGLGRRATNWLEVFGATLTFVFFALLAWQLVVFAGEEFRSGNSTMTVKLLTWPWWTITAALAIACVPVQAVVLAGHLRRALGNAGGPGGVLPATEEDITLGIAEPSGRSE